MSDIVDVIREHCGAAVRQEPGPVDAPRTILVASENESPDVSGSDSGADVAGTQSR